VSLAEFVWLSLGAYAIHVAEEFMLDWRGWARGVLKLPVEWGDFYIVNAVVVVLGIVAAAVADRLPAVALGYSALMLVNATFFHVLPFAVTRGRFSPGLITAILLFYPAGFGAYAAAADQGALSTGALLGSILIGAALMASPIVFLKLRGLAYFRQDGAAPPSRTAEE